MAGNLLHRSKEMADNEPRFSFGAMVEVRKGTDLLKAVVLYPSVSGMSESEILLAFEENVNGPYLDGHGLICLENEPAIQPFGSEVNERWMQFTLEIQEIEVQLTGISEPTAESSSLAEKLNFYLQVLWNVAFEIKDALKRNRVDSLINVCIPLIVGNYSPAQGMLSVDLGNLLSLDMSIWSEENQQKALDLAGRFGFRSQIEKAIIRK